jgi:hypothetical protein
MSAAFAGDGHHLNDVLKKITVTATEVDYWFRLHCREDFIGNFAQSNPAAALEDACKQWPDLDRIEVQIDGEAWTYSRPKFIHEMQHKILNLTIEDAAAVSE